MVDSERDLKRVNPVEALRQMEIAVQRIREQFKRAFLSAQDELPTQSDAETTTKL
jgi:hypothetical protein